MTVDFAQFWECWPRKQAKKDAQKAWAKLAPSEDLASRIIAAVELRKHTIDWIKDDGQFIPYPATWLRGERWADEIFPAIGPKRTPGSFIGAAAPLGSHLCRICEPNHWWACGEPEICNGKTELVCQTAAARLGERGR